MSATHKTCGTCQQSQPVSEFSVKNKVTGTLQSRCKGCVRDYGRRHYAANTEVYLEKAARHNDVARERNTTMVAQSLAGQECAGCGHGVAGDLHYYNGSIENGQSVSMAVRSGLSEAAVLEAIGRSTVICTACRNNHFSNNIIPWANLTQAQRTQLQADRVAAGFEPKPSGYYKDYRRVAHAKVEIPKAA